MNLWAPQVTKDMLPKPLSFWWMGLVEKLPEITRFFDTVHPLVATALATCLLSDVTKGTKF